jgi:hypothetical protein
LKKFKTVSYILAISILIYLLIEKDIFSNLKKLNTEVYLISFLSYLILFYISGFQTSVVVEKSTGIKIGALDKLLIPITQNFWGYLLPVQGSFIYSLAIFKNKYGISLSKSFYLYVFMTLFSVWIAGIVAFIHGIVIKQYYHTFFFLHFVLMPMYTIFLHSFAKSLLKKNRYSKFLRYQFLQLFRVIQQNIRDFKHFSLLIVLDFLFVIIYAFWTFYLSEYFKLNIDFIVWFLWSYFLKITLLAKLTPGNIGVIQAYTAGFLVLYGYSSESGILISIIQLVLLIVLIFPIAIVNSFFNLKYMDVQFLKRNKNG